MRLESRLVLVTVRSAATEPEQKITVEWVQGTRPLSKPVSATELIPIRPWKRVGLVRVNEDVEQLLANSASRRDRLNRPCGRSGSAPAG